MQLNDKERLRILLEEYKIGAEIYMNENRIRWTRYEIHLALSSGLVTIWVYFLGLPSSWLSYIMLIAMASIGVFVAGTWFFMVNRGYGVNDYWQEHLRRIQGELKKLSVHAEYKLFDEKFEDGFWRKQSWWNRRRFRKLAQVLPVLFIICWLGFWVLTGLLLSGYLKYP